MSHIYQRTVDKYQTKMIVYDNTHERPFIVTVNQFTTASQTHT